MLFPTNLRIPARVLAVAAVASLLIAALPVGGASTPARVPLGLDMGSAKEATSLGAPPAFGSFWVGPWMAQHGWAGLDNALKTARETGVTPIVYWYYWGDSITPSCVENGCDGRSKAQWDQLSATLVDKLRSMNGAPVLVVLENEFNKGGITDSWYAPTFDGYLEKRAKELKAVPGVKIVLGFGAWSEGSWKNFPKAIASSDYIGFQMMRASTKHDESNYRDAADRTRHLTAYIAQQFNKPSFLYDLALSSYPDAKWERIQAETLDAVFDQLVMSGPTGLQGAVYRSLRDTYMDPKNYFGHAESHWGLRKGTVAKPAWDVWREKANGGGTPPPPPPPPPPPTPAVKFPGSLEAEAMTASTGARSSDSKASGGAVWNLWTNGDLRSAYEANADVYRVTVVARGTPADGVWPDMELRLDGAGVGRATVGSGSLQSYAFDVTLPAKGTLAVAFLNDKLTSKEDRNLFVDVVHVAVAPKNGAPTAAFDVAAGGLVVDVDASASTDPEGDALSYAWSFGDGATAAGMKARHTYAKDGKYAITLTVSDGKASNARTVEVTVERPNAAPVARIAVSGAYSTYTFDASGSTDADGDALSYAWYLSDGTRADGARLTHTFPAKGSYSVALVVTDARGATSTESVSVDATPEPFAATFSRMNGNNWWVTANVDANRPVVSVCASVDGGACRPLEKRWWGAWASSFHVPTGSDIVFVATADTGEVATSMTVDWPSGAPALKAEFAPYDGNHWWVQARIAATAEVRDVCASINGGECKALALRPWGAWAASHHAPDGAQVEFRVTGADGQIVRSATYTWPVK